MPTFTPTRLEQFGADLLVAAGAPLDIAEFAWAIGVIEQARQEDGTMR